MISGLGIRKNTSGSFSGSVIRVSDVCNIALVLQSSMAKSFIEFSSIILSSMASFVPLALPKLRELILLSMCSFLLTHALLQSLPGLTRLTVTPNDNTVSHFLHSSHHNSPRPRRDSQILPKILAHQTPFPNIFHFYLIGNTSMKRGNEGDDLSDEP